MSGRVEFDREKFEAMVNLALGLPRLRPGNLAWFAYRCDMDSYRAMGRSITGATYVKGTEYPEVRELGRGWFVRRVLRERPAWTRACGYLAAGVVVLRAVRS